MEEKFKMLIEKCISILDAEAINEVWYYYNHDEYEMALEGLLIELTSAGKYPDDYDLNELDKLVEYYDVKNELIFDVNIIEKYMLYRNAWSKK